MNWVEKYRPKTLSEVLGHTKVKEELKKWIEEYLNGKNPKPVILVGPPGCGKTTLANALANDYGFDIIELNASDKRNREVIKNIVGGASVSKSLTGRRILIVLDEVDGLSGNNDRGGVSEILKVIRNSKNPIILTANDIYKPTLSSLRSACKVIKLTPVHTNSIVPLLRRIALKENLNVDEKTLKTIAKHAGGDVRAAINDLESLAMGGSINPSEAKELGDRDVERNIFDALRIIFKTTHYDIALHSTQDVKEDIGTIEEWIAENIPREYKKIDDVVRAYDYLSKADIFLGRVNKRQYYGLWRYANALMTAGVSLAKDEKYRGFVQYVRPTIFTKLMKSKGKRDILKRILNKISIKTHTTTKKSRDFLPYLIFILENNPYVGAQLIRYFELTSDEVSVLTNKNIAKKIFKIIKDIEKEEIKNKTAEITKKENEKIGAIMDVNDLTVVNDEGNKNIIINNNINNNSSNNIKINKINRDNKININTNSTNTDNIVSKIDIKEDEKKEKSKSSKKDKKRKKREKEGKKEKEEKSKQITLEAFLK